MMQRSPEMNEIAKAICAIQKEVKAVPKAKQAFNYKYADHSAIVEMITPICAKHGVAIIQTVHSDEEAVNVGLTTLLLHTSGQFIEDTLYLPPADVGKCNDVQKLGASITYGRRYSLSSMLNLSTEEDTDGVVDPKAKPAPSGKPTVKPPEKNPAKTTKDSHGNFTRISDTQGKRLLAIASGNGWSRGEIREYVFFTHEIEHLRDIPPDLYEGIVKQFEKQNPTTAKAE